MNIFLLVVFGMIFLLLICAIAVALDSIAESLAKLEGLVNKKKEV